MRRSCNNISTINDDIPETTEQFALSLQRTFPEDPLIRVEPDNINFTLNDDDSKCCNLGGGGGGGCEFPFFSLTHQFLRYR